MSDGDGESGRDFKQQGFSKRSKHGCDEFGKAVAQIAVAQICEGEGFQSFQQSALETLANVAVRYVQNLGKSATINANLAGRSECNAFDLIQSLEDVAAVQGFVGASEIDRCLGGSGVIKEIVQYVGESEEIPCAYDLPQFLIVKERTMAPSFSQLDVEPPEFHIPSWLPAFPDPQTYVSALGKAGNDKRVDQMDQFERPGKRKEDNLLSNSHHRMPHNGLEGPPAEPGLSSMAARVSESNPFLAPPLKYGEVEASPVVFPSNQVRDSVTSSGKTIMANHTYENHFMEMDNEASTANYAENHLHDPGIIEVATLRHQRAAVKFSIRVNKKYLVTDMDADNEENSVQDSPTWIEMNESEKKKGDKKWMGDKNLKGPMENPEELAQL